MQMDKVERRLAAILHLDVPPRRFYALSKKQWQKMIVVLRSLLLVTGAIVVTLYFFFPPPHPPPLITPSTQSEPDLSLPDKPSIAVLPFVNIGSESEQDYVGDSVTVALITDLSQFSGLFVIAPQSVFSYQSPKTRIIGKWPDITIAPQAGQSIKPRQVSRELGVQYVVEGSVSKAHDRLQISVTLVDATRGYFLWPNRLWTGHYDRPVQEIFAVKNEIAQRLVATLGIEPTEEEKARLSHLPRHAAEAYGSFLCEYYVTSDASTHGGADRLVERLAQLDERTLDLDPRCALARGLRWNGSSVMLITEFTQWRVLDPQILDRALTLAQRAVTLDDSLPQAYLLVGYIYLCKKQYDKAIAAARQAIDIAPNCAVCYVVLSQILGYAGQPAEAIGLVQKAMRLNPRSDLRLYFSTLGRAYRLTGQYEEAVAAYRKAIPGLLTLTDDWFGQAIAYGELGHEEEARSAVELVLEMLESFATARDQKDPSYSLPNYSLEVVRQGLLYKDPAVAEQIIAALRKAGLK